jgi:hypothetical protein
MNTNVAIQLSQTALFMWLAIFMLLLAVLLAACIASFTHLFFGAPFRAAFKSGLKSSGLLCLLFYLAIVGLKQLAPQQATPPSGAAAPQTQKPPSGDADPKTTDAQQNNR